MGAKCMCTAKHKKVRNKQSNVTTGFKQKNPVDREKKILELWEKIFIKYSSFNNPIRVFSMQNPLKFKKLLILGPPSYCRWQAWKSCFRVGTKNYENLEIKPEYQDLIEKDIPRTFPNFDYFKSDEGLESLKTVLIGATKLNPELGYCQGMNYIAGILLCVSGGKVEESIYLMDCFINQLRVKELFEPGFSRAETLKERFKIAMKTSMEKLYEHFLDIGLDENLWVHKWIMTMFSYSFNFKVAVRLWDIILATNLDFMINLCIGLLATIEMQLRTFELDQTLEFFDTFKFNEINVDIENVIDISFRFSFVDNSAVEAGWNRDSIEDYKSIIKVKWNFDDCRSALVPEPVYRKTL